MGNVQTAASAHDVLWRQTPSGELVDLGRPLRLPLSQLRLQSTPKSALSRREKILLGVFALALHGAVAYWVSQAPTPVVAGGTAPNSADDHRVFATGAPGCRAATAATAGSGRAAATGGR